MVLVVCGCVTDREQIRPVPYAHWESASVQSNGIRIHYWRTGGPNKPVVIMAHGFSDYGLMWSSLAEKFQNEYDIIMYDVRGHGFSSKPDGPYDLATHVEDLAGLVKALEIQKPILVGHSMGSGIMILAGATYPNMPRAIILEDPAMAEMIETIKSIDLSARKRSLEAEKAMGKKKLIELARKKRHPGWSYSYEYDLWAEAKLLVSPNIVNVLSSIDMGKPEENFPKIVAPTLVLKADADQASRKTHQKIADLLPNGTLVHIVGAGHLVRLDKPAETEHQIRVFLDGVK